MKAAARQGSADQPKEARMRVSALITTYNHAAYIDAALDSLLAQTHADIEIIVADDGSTDGTFERAGRFEARGVTVWRADGEGPSQAMNANMLRATGDVFVLQSGDDVSLPHRVTRQLELLARADVTFAAPQVIDRSGSPVPDDEMPSFVRKVEPGSEALFRSLFLEGNFICASSVALRRSAWERVGGFNAGLLQLQDYDWWMRALCAELRFAADDDQVAQYRWHGANLSDFSNATRIYRELAFILREVAEKAPEPLLSAVHFGSAAKAQVMPRSVLAALCCLQHESELVRQVGADLMIRIMNRADCDTMIGPLGLSRRAMFEALRAK